MIKLTRLDDTQILLNCDLICHVEISHNAVVFMTTGESFVVQETADQIEAMVVRFKRRIFGLDPLTP